MAPDREGEYIELLKDFLASGAEVPEPPGEVPLMSSPRQVRDFIALLEEIPGRDRQLALIAEEIRRVEAGITWLRLLRATYGSRWYTEGATVSEISAAAHVSTSYISRMASRLGLPPRIKRRAPARHGLD
jgi:hypothetical protein